MKAQMGKKMEITNQNNNIAKQQLSDKI